MKSDDSTPFHEDGYVYFELESDALAVLEFGGEPAVYTIDNFMPGIYRIHVDAIVPANSVPGPTISVDSAQLFFIDAALVAAFEEAFDYAQGAWPNYDYFVELRDSISTRFGYLVSGAETPEHFDGDGVYSLDIRRLQYPGQFRDEGKPEPVGLDLYVKVAKSMKTYVCSNCFEDEFMIGFGDKGYYTDAAQEAIELGWRVTSEPSSFGKFSVLCPACAGRKEGLS